MDPELVTFTGWLALAGKNVGGGGGSEPTDSPLKVWDGTEWQPAGIAVED